VEQVGAPREIYETPRTVFVAGFIGNTNLLSGHSRGGAAIECGGVTIATAGAALTAGAAVTVAVRPERIRLEDTGGLDNQVAATVAHVVYQGETVRYVLAADGGLELQAVELGRVRFPAGARVRAGWAAADARVLTS
jgi:ABC-type Fe3+/spermidine/putrescine transport system ATPase subunit